MIEASTSSNSSTVVARSPTLQTFEQALDRPITRKMPRTMRDVAVRRAAGKTPGQIAKELQIPGGIVEQYIAQMVHCLHCQPPAPIATSAKPKTGGSGSRAAVLQGGGQLATIETTCQSCGNRIEEGGERMAVALMHIICGDLDYLDEDSADDRPGSGSTTSVMRVFHFCRACGESEEIRVINPWHLTQEDLKWLEECDAEERARQPIQSASPDLNQRLAAAVANGEMHDFNKLMPTKRARRDDVMSRAVLFSRLEERAEISNEQTGGNADMSPNEVVDAIASTSSPSTKPVYVDVNSRALGEGAQRAKVLGYLNSPASRGRFTSDRRKLLKMWAEDDLSQNELSRKLGINQGTISQIIGAARKLASAPR